MDSIQIENIKEIDYLKSILDRIEAHGIDVSNYYNELDTIIDNYEKHKKSELNIPEEKLHLTVNVDSKYELSINLNFLHNKLNWCTLFLSLMDITENWDLDISIDETFYSIYNNVENILEYIYDVDIQEKVVIKYYDLILKKILKDYKDNKYDYLEEYNNLKKNNYLKDSIMRFLENKNIIFDGNINCYSLKDIIERVFVPDNRKEEIVIEEELKKDIVEVNDVSGINNLLFSIKKFYNTVIKNEQAMVLKNISSLKKEKKILNFFCKNYLIKRFGLTKDYFEKENVDLSYFGNFYTMKKVVDKVYNRDSEDKIIGLLDSNRLYERVIYRIINKDLSYIDFKGLNLSSIDFTDVDIFNSDLSGTKARIDPQRVDNIKWCYLEGCYVINDFNGYSNDRMPILLNTILVNSFDEILGLEIKLRLGMNISHICEYESCNYYTKAAFIKNDCCIDEQKRLSITKK